MLLGLTAGVSLPMLAWPNLKKSPLLTWSRPLQPEAWVPPYRLASYTSLMNLVSELEKPQYSSSRFLILASSMELNPSIVEALSPKIKSRLVVPGDVDQRDGFNAGVAFEAEYIVTTREPSIHLRPQDQQVIILPTEALFNRSSLLSKHYEMIPELSFPLADGNTIVLFKRISNPSSDAITWLRAQFNQRYPDWIYSRGIIGPH